MPKIVYFLADILLRFYMEIIAGVWAVIIIIPIDSALYDFFTREKSYPIGFSYWVFVGCYTTFFIVSGALIPMIKKKRILKTIDSLERKKQINYNQKKKIIKTIENISAYQPIQTKDGFLNFIMENLFSFSVMFAWFGIEGVISNTMHGETLIVPIIFNLLFLALLMLHSFLDDYIAQQMRLKYKNKTFSNLCKTSKILITQLVSDIGGGGSSDKIGQLLLEQTIEDIGNIIDISGNTNKSKSKIKKN